MTARTLLQRVLGLTVQNSLYQYGIIINELNVQHNNFFLN